MKLIVVGQQLAVVRHHRVQPFDCSNPHLPEVFTGVSRGKVASSCFFESEAHDIAGSTTSTNRIAPNSFEAAKLATK